MPWSVSSEERTPARRSSRRMRRALLSTICRWTHEWSLMPRRWAVTCCSSQYALSFSLALAASSSWASLRLRSLGARMWIAAVASLGVWTSSVICARR